MVVDAGGEAPDSSEGSGSGSFEWVSGKVGSCCFWGSEEHTGLGGVGWFGRESGQWDRRRISGQKMEEASSRMCNLDLLLLLIALM